VDGKEGDGADGGTEEMAWMVGSTTLMGQCGLDDVRNGVSSTL
jgi:hypothetical protein